MEESPRHPPRWPTGLFSGTAAAPRLRGYALADLAGEASFVAGIHLALRGELPDESQLLLLEALLLANLEADGEDPSVLAARQSASLGNAPLAALAAGLLTYGPLHGGAVGTCLRLLSEILRRAADTGETVDETADQVAVEQRASGRPLPGFGVAGAAVDLRVQRLFELAEASELPLAHVVALRALQRAAGRLRSTGAAPIALPGVSAALMGALGYEPQAAVLVLALARLPALAGQILEERAECPPGRRVAAASAPYDGPADRPVPPGGLREAKG